MRCGNLMRCDPGLRQPPGLRRSDRRGDPMGCVDVMGCDNLPHVWPSHKLRQHPCVRRLRPPRASNGCADVTHWAASSTSWAGATSGAAATSCPGATSSAAIATAATTSWATATSWAAPRDGLRRPRVWRSHKLGQHPAVRRPHGLQRPHILWRPHGLRRHHKLWEPHGVRQPPGLRRSCGLRRWASGVLLGRPGWRGVHLEGLVLGLGAQHVLLQLRLGLLVVVLLLLLAAATRARTPSEGLRLPPPPPPAPPETRAPVRHGLIVRAIFTPRARACRALTHARARRV